MNTYFLMIVAIVLGSAVSLVGGSLLFLTKKRRENAVNLALPLGAGALLAAAFLDLLPEAFHEASPETMLMWALGGFLLFFILERTSSWFHHHHEDMHDGPVRSGEHQNRLVIIGDLMHNIIDGVAIGAAFLTNPVTGFVTTLAVSAHEIPKEIGTFGILLSRGWRDKKVIVANIATAVGTLVAASLVYLMGAAVHLPVPELLSLTAGFFMYVAASDIIPFIHEQPRKLGRTQAVVLVAAVILVGLVIKLLGV